MRNIAFRALRRLAANASDHLWDWKLGVRTGRIFESDRAAGANRVESCPYSALARLFAQVSVTPDDVLVDMGCGEGRVLRFWASRFPNHMVGLELLPRLAAETAAHFAGNPRVRVVVGDAIENLPADGTLFFVYNSFVRPVVERFAARLKAVCVPGTRLVYIPGCAEVFQSDPAFACTPLPGGWLCPGSAFLVRFLG